MISSSSTKSVSMLRAAELKRPGPDTTTRHLLANKTSGRKVMGLCIWSELLQHVCKSAGPHSTFRDDGRGGKGSWSCKKEEGGGLSHLTVAAYRHRVSGVCHTL